MLATGDDTIKRLASQHNQLQEQGRELVNCEDTNRKMQVDLATQKSLWGTAIDICKNNGSLSEMQSEKLLHGCMAIDANLDAHVAKSVASATGALATDVALIKTTMDGVALDTRAIGPLHTTVSEGVRLSPVYETVLLEKLQPKAPPMPASAPSSLPTVTPADAGAAAAPAK